MASCCGETGVNYPCSSKVVKADWEDNFGQLLTIVEPGLEGKVVDKILISLNAVFMFYYNSCTFSIHIACTITSRVKG